MTKSSIQRMKLLKAYLISNPLADAYQACNRAYDLVELRNNFDFILADLDSVIGRRIRSVVICELFKDFTKA